MASDPSTIGDPTPIPPVVVSSEMVWTGDFVRVPVPRGVVPRKATNPENKPYLFFCWYVAGQKRICAHYYGANQIGAIGNRIIARLEIKVRTFDDGTRELFIDLYDPPPHGETTHRFAVHPRAHEFKGPTPPDYQYPVGEGLVIVAKIIPSKKKKRRKKKT